MDNNKKVFLRDFGSDWIRLLDYVLRIRRIVRKVSVSEKRRKYMTVSKSGARKKEEVNETSSVKDAMKSVELSSEMFRPAIRKRSSVCRDVWRRTESVVVELKEWNGKV